VRLGIPLQDHADELRGEDTPCEIEQAARDLLKIADDSTFEREWDALDSLHPGNPAVFATRIRRLIRRKETDRAIALLDGGDFGARADVMSYMLKAELLYEAQEHERARELFLSLMETDGDHKRDVAMRYAKRLFADGSLARAVEVIDPVRDCFGEGGKGHNFIVKIDTLMALLTRLEGRSPGPDENCRMLAMKHAILHFRHRETVPPKPRTLGRLSLITGGLGPGGAERQLTRLAIELERARKTHGSIAGIKLDRPIEVLVRSHAADKQNDFYLGEVSAAKVELRQINFFPVIPPAELTSHPELLLLLDYLPPVVNFGVRRLTRHFIESETDVASVWQDGACLFSGLAALLAGVPQIQLAIRGLPPSMRRHMFRPEYEVFYRAMAQIPGVTFLSNSISAARAYAGWLDIPLDRFAIVYNGVEPMSAQPSPSCQKQWADFTASTAGASHTIGGVFRFDTDKQPLLWIRFAARYLKRHPDSRIVLVGGGRLLPNAIELAEEYGITDRILFVGRSSNVGFWMSKMDVLVLLSRFEGLPNVLIEAQYMGLRVVTTPAGGAAECLIDGVTGHVLGCAEQPDYNEIVENTHKWALRSNEREIFAPGGLARGFLDSHFSIPHMLGQFVSCTAQGFAGLTTVEPQRQQSLRAA
jgi:Vi polysaccharide biosynthesis protein TviE